MDKNMTRTLKYQGQGHGDCDKTNSRRKEQEKDKNIDIHMARKKENGCSFMCDSMRKKKNTEKDMIFSLD
jgi:hypothetical protein